MTGERWQQKVASRTKTKETEVADSVDQDAIDSDELPELVVDEGSNEHLTKKEWVRKRKEDEEANTIFRYGDVKNRTYKEVAESPEWDEWRKMVVESCKQNKDKRDRFVKLPRYQRCFFEWYEKNYLDISAGRS